MRKQTVRQMSFVCAMAGTSMLWAQAGEPIRWQLGEPIVTYWAGPGEKQTDQEAAQLIAGGWNLGWACSVADLDTQHRHGIRGLLVIGVPDVEDPAQAKALETTIEQVRNHPALYGYHLVDEPGSGAFPKLGRLVAFLRERDPAHMAYINLLPTYANEAQLQVTDDQAEKARVGIPQDFAGIKSDQKTALRYREYLRAFIDIVKPDLISYDHYHFMKHGDGPQYFLNLAMIRSAALAANKPFLNIIQTCDSPAEGWRGPGEHELRWLTYTSLAYGALGISHFRYDTGLWKSAGDTLTPLPLYWSVSRLNRDFLAIATEVQKLKSLGAYHCGKLPMGAEALPTTSRFVPEPRDQEVLLGCFGESAAQATHVLVVNLDYRKPCTTTLVGPAPMERFHAPTRTWSEPTRESRITLDFAPGGGVLLRVRG